MDAYAVMQELLAHGARNKAAHDGVAPSLVHVVAAYNDLWAALRHEYESAVARGAEFFAASPAEADVSAAPARKAKAKE